MVEFVVRFGWRRSGREFKRERTVELIEACHRLACVLAYGKIWVAKHLAEPARVIGVKVAGIAGVGACSETA
jgi:hypothetical protein